MTDKLPEIQVFNSSSIYQGGVAYPSTAVETHQGPSSSVLSILMLALLFLGLAHLAVKEFFPSPFLWVIGAAVIVAAGVGWILVRKDYFGLLLALFVCVHFGFAEHQGGFWSYIICAVFFVGIALGLGQPFKLSSVPLTANIFLLIFLFQQLLGTILNPYSLIENIQATVVTCSQIIIFYYFASQKMTELNLKRFLSVWFATACWVFVMALNQKYHWLITTSPVLPQIYGFAGKLGSIPAGSFQNTELFSEYFCIVFVLWVTILSSLKELADLRIKKILPLFMVLLSLAAIIMGSSRAAALLAIAAAIYLTFLNFVVAPSARNLQRLLILMVVITISGMLIFSMGKYFSLQDMVKKFGELKPSQINVDTVISGKGINRSFTGGYHLLRKGSWWVGYGYNLPENNHKSLGIAKDVADYHSLYVILPFFYGWMGAAAFVLLVFGTGLRIYRCYLKNRKRSYYLVPIALGLAVVWGVFLLDEYKISITRNPSYFLLTWMWLGLTHAVANSMRHETQKLKRDV